MPRLHPFLAVIVLGLSCVSLSPRAAAQVTVECHSVKYRYSECRAPLQAPQLVHQISSSPCVVNHSWGFNRKTGYLWVSDGCAGVFADGGAYHHGQSGGYDPGARQYDDRGHDVGAMMAGAMIGAAIGSAGSHSSHSYSYSNFNSTTNVYTNRDYTATYEGNHRITQVDDPDAARDTSQDVDPTVQKFDKDGNPNYDADGGYIGGHGIGTQVDNPDAGGSDDSSGSETDDPPSG